MTRSESEIAATLATTANVVVDTDAFVSTIKRRAGQRRRARLAMAGGATAVLAIGVGAPIVLVSPNRTGTGGTDPIPSGTAWMPRVFTGECALETIADPVDVEPGHPVILSDLDPTGRYAVGTYGPPRGKDGSWSNTDGVTGRVLPVRWENGVGRVVPVAGENLSDAYVSGVNRHGVVVGGLQLGSSQGRVFAAWVSLDGTAWSLLPTPPDYDEAYAIGVNDGGEIIGIAEGSAGRDAVVWSAGAGGGWTYRVIGTPRGQVAAVTDDGVVVGTLASGQPYAWLPDGTERALPLPEGTTWGRVAEVRGQWATGVAGVPDNEHANASRTTHVLRWNVRSGEMSIVGTGAVAGRTVAVNVHGDVAWARVDGGGGGQRSTVVLARGSTEYTLPGPLAGATHAEPVALNDDATLAIGSAGEVWSC